MLAIILANGSLEEGDREALQSIQADLVLAADGGAVHCLALGIRPDMVVGDFDSLGEGDLAQLQAQGASFEQHPARKDFTDLELAVMTAIHQGADEVHVYGGLGDRWDMNAANLMLLAHPDFKPARLELIAGRQRICLVRPGQPLSLQGKPGDTLSLVPLCSPVIGVTTAGLEYPLEDEALTFGATRGVSNVLIAAEARVTLVEGELLCIHTKNFND